MTQNPRISDAEWEIMKILWSKQRSSAKDVIEALQDKADWSPKTIRTLLNRLVQKRAAAYEITGRNYTYYPVVSEEECIHAETQSFLKRLYDGALKPMLVNFIQEEKLSKEDIQELKDLLDEKNR